MNTNFTNFSKEVQSWNGIASSFDDIYVEANNNDWLEWYVTVSKISNGNEFKFHFMVFWHNGWCTSQPKICLLFGQRCMIKCSNFYGNWLLLDKNIKTFSITAVLLGLRNIVRRINVNNINHDIFNSYNSIYCDYTRKQEINSKKKELNIDNKNISSISNSSMSNSSMVSLTFSNYTDNTVDTVKTNNKEITINLETKIPIIDNDAVEISTKSMLVSTSNNEKIRKCEHELISKTNININEKSILKPKSEPKIELNKEKSNKKMESEIKFIKLSNNNEKIKTSEPELISKIKINMNKKITGKLTANPKVKLAKKTSKNNKQIEKEEKEAVRYLEIDENGRLVWKWSEGKKPNQKILLNSSSTSCRWVNKKN